MLNSRSKIHFRAQPSQFRGGGTEFWICNVLNAIVERLNFYKRSGQAILKNIMYRYHV